MSITISSEETLKLLLFEEICSLEKKIKRAYEGHSKWYVETSVAEAKRNVLYGIIVKSGFEEEYEKWKGNEKCLRV